MVEKIIVNPESIRAYGNIIMPKTGADFEEYNCTMEVAEDTINNETVPVYVLTPETTTISLVLTSDVSTVTVGGNVVLSVTVTEDEVPVSGQSVSFKLGSTELGTSTTNSSGVATYTYTTVSSGSLNFSAVYAGHSSNGVSVVVNKRSTSTSLSLGSASIVVGGSTTASATVTSSSSGVSGLTVTFKDGSTTLGTSTTNSSGIATYTISGLNAGNHSITAVVTEDSTYAASTSSAVTLTVNNHSYSLAFSAASYVATGGSATLECTLLDNNVPVEGATISVSGSDSSLYTGITNSQGLAEITVYNITGTVTFTANYSNVTDTCTVSGVTYLFYDECSSSAGLTNYGSLIQLESSSYLATLEYDSTENAYKVTSIGDAKSKSFPITTLNNADKFTIEADIKRNNSRVGLAISSGTGYGYCISITVDTQFEVWKYTNKSWSNQGATTATITEWVNLKLTIDGLDVSILLTNANGDTYTKTLTLDSRYTNRDIGILSASQSANQFGYIKNIKAEAL